MYECPRCGAVFTEHRKLLRHRSSFHQEKGLFACDKCGRKFNTHGGKWVHRCLDSLLVPCKFPHCQYAGTEAAMKKHVKTVHMKLYHKKCPRCERTFSAGQLVLAHLRKTNGLCSKSIEAKARPQSSEDRQGSPILTPEINSQPNLEVPSNSQTNSSFNTYQKTNDVPNLSIATRTLRSTNRNKSFGSKSNSCSELAALGVSRHSTSESGKFNSSTENSDIISKLSSINSDSNATSVLKSNVNQDITYEIDIKSIFGFPSNNKDEVSSHGEKGCIPADTANLSIDDNLVKMKDILERDSDSEADKSTSRSRIPVFETDQDSPISVMNQEGHEPLHSDSDTDNMVNYTIISSIKDIKPMPNVRVEVLILPVFENPPNQKKNRSDAKNANLESNSKRSDIFERNRMQRKRRYSA